MIRIPEDTRGIHTGIRDTKGKPLSLSGYDMYNSTSVLHIPTNTQITEDRPLILFNNSFFPFQ